MGKKHIYIIAEIGINHNGDIELCKKLIDVAVNSGFKSVKWNATNYKNEPVSAGLYLYTIQAGEFRQTKKMVLLKSVTYTHLTLPTKRIV